MKLNALKASWIVRINPNPLARWRLFCFPHSGGGPQFFRTWPEDAAPEIEICAAQPPGREGRFWEKPLSRIAPIVSGLTEAIEDLLDLPFAFFGHSVGGLISFELARELRRRNQRGPSHLFVSAHRAPHLPDRNPPKHAMEEPEFMNAIRKYNGTPELVLKEPDLMRLFMPLLRADFSITETYVYREDDPLDLPITVFGGSLDETVRASELEAWKSHTRDVFRLKMLPGDHFYLKHSRKRLLAEIAEDLEMAARFQSPGVIADDIDSARFGPFPI